MPGVPICVMSLARRFVARTADLRKGLPESLQIVAGLLICGRPTHLQSFKRLSISWQVSAGTLARGHNRYRIPAQNLMSTVLNIDGSSYRWNRLEQPCPTLCLFATFYGLALQYGGGVRMLMHLGINNGKHQFQVCVRYMILSYVILQLPILLLRSAGSPFAALDFSGSYKLRRR